MFIDMLSFLCLSEGTQTGNQTFRGELDSNASNNTLMGCLFEPFDVSYQRVQFNNLHCDEDVFFISGAAYLRLSALLLNLPE